MPHTHGLWQSSAGPLFSSLSCFLPILQESVSAAHVLGLGASESSPLVRVQSLGLSVAGIQPQPPRDSALSVEYCIESVDSTPGYDEICVNCQFEHVSPPALCSCRARVSGSFVDQQVYLPVAPAPSTLFQPRPGFCHLGHVPLV